MLFSINLKINKKTRFLNHAFLKYKNLEECLPERLQPSTESIKLFKTEKEVFGK
jgi:hypothetical protein